MRCPECLRKNDKNALYCAGCGTKLAGKEASPRKPLGIIFAVLAICAALAACACFLKACMEDAKEAAEPTPAPTRPVLPKPTSAGIVHGWTNTPTEAPTPSPVPTPTPTPTPVPTPTPTPDPVWEEDMEPIDSLIDFILTGKVASVRNALAPEYITYAVSGHGYTSGMIGGEDSILKLLGGMIVSGLKLQYGDIYGITYSINERLVLSESEIEAMHGELSGYGMTDMPTEAHRLDLTLVINASKGTERLEIVPRVLLINGKWYLHPGDLEDIG